MEIATLTIAALLTVDMLQTYSIADECKNPRRRYHESNIILGKCPSKMAITGYFAAISPAILYSISSLPVSYHGVQVKKIAQHLAIFIEGQAVYNNYSMGVNLSLPF